MIFDAARTLVGGCRHKRMSWPICLDGHSYRVCLDCGIQQLFDEATMRSYGPYVYDLNKVNGREGMKVSHLR
jgi:hypothetical protein